MKKRNRLYLRSQVLFLCVCLLFSLVGCKNQAEELQQETTAATTQLKQDRSKPLKMEILTGDIQGQSIVGTYSWNYLEDGQWKAANASGSHPLDSESILTVFSSNVETARLEFGDQPEHISVRCWSSECFGEPSATPESVTMNGYTAYLKPGSYVYEVAAQWDADGGDYHGVAYYCFYVTYNG